MKAKDFIEDEEYQNAPQKDKMKKNIRLFSGPSKDEEWVILSYYYSPELGNLVLDIAPKKVK